MQRAVLTLGGNFGQLFMLCSIDGDDVRHWDWDELVEANRGRLIGLLAGLFAMLGTNAFVPRRVKREILARLVPMEAALRRLIFIVACDLPIPVIAVRECPARVPTGKGSDRKPVFRLTDPPRIPDPKPRNVPPGREPRILFLDEWAARPGKPPPEDDDLMSASALRRRLEAMEAALADLPGQARRLARWYARRDRMRAKTGFSRFYPIRSGRAPGHRADGERDEDEVLANCHELALDARNMVEKERASAR